MQAQTINPLSTRLLRAAQYLRMSTDLQQYSIANQSAAIALYAAAHNIAIVRSFVDEGKSGTSIKGREGLQSLLRCVQAGAADFNLILVYDVSRWGRFSDTDEAAHYEYLCKRAGIRIHYCAEQFENDNSTVSNLLKALKRTMAGEYSRELSAKVFAGRCRLASMGYWQGGPAPFGFVRQIVSPDGKPKHLLLAGEQKSVKTDRTVLVPGPPDAVATIRKVFDLFCNERKTVTQIARILNATGVLFDGKPWRHGQVSAVLKNPLYKGTMAFCRYDFKTGRKFKSVPKEQWRIRENAFPGIITSEQFARAQQIIERRAKRFNKPELLKGLQRVLRQHGKLNQFLIEAAEDLPSSQVFVKRFGGLAKAYELVGYQLKRDFTFVSIRRIGREIVRTLADEICYRVRAMGGTAVYQGVLSPRQPASAALMLNEGISVAIILSSGRTWRYRHTVWPLHTEQLAGRDVLIIVRLTADHASILDYYVVPVLSQLRWKFVTRIKDNPAFLDLYRTDTLQQFTESFRRFNVEALA